MTFVACIICITHFTPVPSLAVKLFMPFALPVFITVMFATDFLSCPVGYRLYDLIYLLHYLHLILFIQICSLAIKV